MLKQAQNSPPPSPAAACVGLVVFVATAYLSRASIAEGLCAGARAAAAVELRAAQGVAQESAAQLEVAQAEMGALRAQLSAAEEERAAALARRPELLLQLADRALGWAAATKCSLCELTAALLERYSAALGPSAPLGLAAGALLLALARLHLCRRRAARAPEHDGAREPYTLWRKDGAWRALVWKAEAERDAAQAERDSAREQLAKQLEASRVAAEQTDQVWSKRCADADAAREAVAAAYAELEQQAAGQPPPRPQRRSSTSSAHSQRSLLPRLSSGPSTPPSTPRAPAPRSGPVGAPPSTPPHNVYDGMLAALMPRTPPKPVTPLAENAARLVRTLRREAERYPPESPHRRKLLDMAASRESQGLGPRGSVPSSPRAARAGAEEAGP